MGIVGAALAEFAEATQTDIQFVVGRISASLMGASDATMAYVNGDLDMALEAQRAARRAQPVSPVDAAAEQRPAPGTQYGYGPV